MPRPGLQISQIRSVVSHLDDGAHFGKMELDLIRISSNAGQGGLESLVKLDVRHRPLEDELVVRPDVGDHSGVKLELRLPVQSPEISLRELHKAERRIRLGNDDLTPLAPLISLALVDRNHQVLIIEVKILPLHGCALRVTARDPEEVVGTQADHPVPRRAPIQARR